MTSSRMVHSVDSSTTYQEANFTKHEQDVTYLTNHRNKYTNVALACLCHVIAQSTDIFNHTLTILAPQGCYKAENAICDLHFIYNFF